MARPPPNQIFNGASPFSMYCGQNNRKYFTSSIASHMTMKISLENPTSLNIKETTLKSFTKPLFVKVLFVSLVFSIFSVTLIFLCDFQCLFFIMFEFGSPHWTHLFELFFQYHFLVPIPSCRIAMLFFLGYP